MSTDIRPWRDHMASAEKPANLVVYVDYEIGALRNLIADLRAELARCEVVVSAPEFDIDSAARRIALAIHEYGILSEGDLYTTIKALLAGSPAVVSEGPALSAVEHAIHNLKQFRAGQAMFPSEAVNILERFVATHLSQAVVSEGQAAAASDVAQGWLQFIDGVKTQNFARDEQELATTKSIFKVMGHTGKAEYVPVFYTRPAAPAPEAPTAARTLPTDEQIIAALHACAIDTRPSIYGFSELQVDATNVPGIRRVFEKLLAATSAPTAAPAPEVAKTSGFPERDQSKPAEQQGLFRKFVVRRVDGSDQPGGKHQGCRYYVLDLDHDPHASPAMAAYAESCRFSHHQLSDELRAEFGAAPAKPKCDHDWPEGDRGTDIDGFCAKCGLSFQRYIHTEMP